MSEIDLIIAKAAKEMKYSKGSVEACFKTLKDYQANEIMQDGPHLRMIAWDRS